MARTYNARLHGDRIEWIDPPPPARGAVPVRVTLLEDHAPPSGRGAEMARILEAIAARGGLADLGDPIEWQRSMREDRPLPGRD
jgi:hypothetical protein